MKDGKVEGRCELFENGILRLSWVMKDGQRIGRISEYELNRHGKGIEYDENGKLKYEGYWNKDELMRIAR